MSPYEYADSLRKDFEDFANSLNPSVAIPSVSYTKLGDQVIACESLIFSVTDVASQPLFENNMVCGYLQIGTIIASLSRDCAYEMEEDGSENVEQVAAIAIEMDRDSNCLWEWAQRVEPYMVKDFSIGFANTGGLAVTSLSLTLGIP